MDGQLYLTYLKLFPTKRPSLVLWSHLILWLVALSINLVGIAGKSYDSPLWLWVISFLVVVWCIAGVWHWSKLLWSKRQIDKLLKV